MLMRFFPLILVAVLAGCAVEPVQPVPASTPAVSAPPTVSRTQANANFRAVVARVEPVAERECRRRTEGVNCDFKIVVDNRDQPPNAFQTLERDGRPVIGFTASLIADARNQDELAFVLGHEAAHHIEGHIPKSQQSAVGGALAGAVLAGVLGLDPPAGQVETENGGTVGARRFSKEFELQAAALGAVIAARAGYNPRRGAEFFNRIPDPGDRFLGTHPPNAERIRTVERVAARL